jgi:uncharacterized protein YgbK (DUF1537 family)
VVRVGIQADDLTGACDTGAAFAARGLATLVLLPDTAMPAAMPEALVLDTESRAAAPAEARARARAAALRLTAGPVALLYKKVDSTLRGSVAAELAGVLEGAARHQAVLAPAFPAQRRTLVDGLLRVGDRVVTETALAGDPAFPPTGASVLALLGADGPHPVGLVPLATVRRGQPAVTARLRRHAGVVACDAERDADLDVLAAATADSTVVLAGSAGFAAALAAHVGTGPRPPVPRLRRPLLVVSGSAHPASREQVARLAARGGTTLLAAPAAPASAPAEREVIGRRLAEAARDAIDRTAPATLLLTGGETAYSVCRALAAAGLELAGELEPGLAVGTLVGGPCAGLTVVTKAGAFGDADALVRVWESTK